MVYDSSLTPQQRYSLGKIYHRPMGGNKPNLLTYYEFRQQVVHSLGCVMVPWCGMWLGIEPDGYVHS